MSDPRLAMLHLDVHPDVEMRDLVRANDVACICEGEFTDSDGETFWVYTVAGELDGQRIEAIDHVRKCIVGATVGGDAMIVHGRSRKEADWVSINALMDSIDGMKVMADHGALDPDGNAGIITETRVAQKAS